MEFSFQKFQDCNKAEWDKFTEESDEAWFWHHSLFIEAWPHGENFSFCIKCEGKTLLEQSLFFHRMKKWRLEKWHGIPFLYRHKYPNCLTSVGGVCVSNNLTAKEKKKLQDFYIQIMDELVEKYRIGSFPYCILPTLSPAFWPEVCPRVNPLIFYGFKNRMSQSYIIDLSLAEDEIFRRFFQTTRNLIYRCQKDKDIKLVEATSSDYDLDAYYALHVETYLRTGATPHPKSYFEKIFKNIIPLKYSHILFLYKKNKLVAAQNTLIYKDVAMYWTGASLTEKGDGENRYLMHEQILYAKRRGCRYFEVGEAFPNIRNGKLKGLNDFKRSFGGFIYPLFAGEYDIHHTKSNQHE